jgi:hypothetical protein
MSLCDFVEFAKTKVHLLKQNALVQYAVGLVAIVAIGRLLRACGCFQNLTQVIAVAFPLGGVARCVAKCCCEESSSMELRADMDCDGARDTAPYSAKFWGEMPSTETETELHEDVDPASVLAGDWLDKLLETAENERQFGEDVH